MKAFFAALAGLLFAGSTWAQIPGLGDMLKGIANPGQPGATVGAGDEKTNAAGIKEALAVATEKAVNDLSRTDGYFANQAVKILMPESIRKVADVARLVGFEKQVDEFVLTMNRAAEAAAPKAVQFFGDAIRSMSLDDVRGILTGGDTAATEFFRRKTQDKLYAAFRPVVAKAVNEAGATRAYTDLVSRYDNVPFVGKQSVDLDDYVTNKSLDGLFLMVAAEEKKIRTNPAARTSELLRSVFGG